MNALEFFAKMTSYSGYEDNGEEITILFPRGEDNEHTYYHMTAEGNRYFYEYLIVEPRERKYEWFYDYLIATLEELPDEMQYEIIKRMKTMEIEFEPEITYDELNGRYHVRSATYQKYPLYSVRGTCKREHSCEHTYCKLNTEPCCKDKKVGISRTSGIKYPEYYEFLPELVVWSALCPDLDAVYVMHDFIPVYYIEAELSFTFAFLLKDNKIKYIEDEEEVKRLYEEYHAKYPCDTSEVEDDINSWYGVVSEFHF